MRGYGIVLRFDDRFHRFRVLSFYNIGIGKGSYPAWLIFNKALMYD